MKSERSDLWLRKKLHLSQREKLAKDELEETSSQFERTVKQVAIVSLVTGVVFFAGYKIYKSINRSENTSSRDQKKDVVEKLKPKIPFTPPRPPFKQVLMERVALMAVQIIGTQLGVFLSRKLEQNEEKED